MCGKAYKTRATIANHVVLHVVHINDCTLLLPGAVIQTAYEVVGAVRVRLGSLSTLCTLTATLDSHEEAAQSPIV